jgi:hypothetical protein
MQTAATHAEHTRTFFVKTHLMVAPVSDRTVICTCPSFSTLASVSSPRRSCKGGGGAGAGQDNTTPGQRLPLNNDAFGDIWGASAGIQVCINRLGTHKATLAKGPVSVSGARVQLTLMPRLMLKRPATLTTNGTSSYCTVGSIKETCSNEHVYRHKQQVLCSTAAMSAQAALCG